MLEKTMNYENKAVSKTNKKYFNLPKISNFSQNEQNIHLSVFYCYISSHYFRVYIVL